MSGSSRKPNRRRDRERFRRIFVEQLEDRSLLATTFTVNSILDTDARDNVLTLREAILLSNGTLDKSSLSPAELAQVGDDPSNNYTIGFNIPGSGVKTITISTQLPTVTGGAIIDGYTQPGAMPNTNAIDDPDPSKRGFNGTLLIELKGNAGILYGLPISNGATVRGLIVNSFLNGISVNSNCVVVGSNIRGNEVDGIVSAGANNRIGGTTPASRNIITGSGYFGIELEDFGRGAAGNVIQGNFIGTDASGTKALGNYRGIFLYQVGGDTIGGTQSGARNVIAGNGMGIEVESSTGNTIQGNFIGVDVTGTTALGNGTGIHLNVGGQTTIVGNVISGNGGAGIGGHGAENVIQGNFIGTDASGTQPLPNLGDGIVLDDFYNRVGGTTAGAGNIIAFNRGNGVSITGAIQSPILSNSIFSNEGLGIDIDASGPNANDPGDADDGANRLQNYPEISSVTRTTTALTLNYAVPSLPANSVYPLRVEFFKADTDGQEGQTFLGFDTYTAAEAGTVKTLSFSPAIPIGVGIKLVATATDGQGNTSEFSPSVTVAGPNVPPVLGEINGGSAITLDESTVALASAPVTNVGLLASDSDWGQSLAFTIAVDSAPPPGCTAYDPNNPTIAALLQISIAGQTPTPGAPPNGSSTASATLRVQAGPNAAGSWCFLTKVSDGVDSDQREVTVLVNRTNSSPSITTNGGGDAASLSIKENTTAVTDVDAADLDAEQSLTYSIVGGADNSKFSVDSSTGVLTFTAAPDFENPTDSDKNNTYEVVVGASDGTSTDTQTISVAVTNVNDVPPVITSNGGAATVSISIPENTTAVADIDAYDPEGAAVTFSRAGGSESSKFSINSSTGVLTFISPPDFEHPTDVDKNNSYTVVIRASDGTLITTQTITVTVTNVNDGPSIYSLGNGGTGTNISVPENVPVVADIDASVEAGKTLTYSISGLDTAQFNIDSSTGLLTFLTAPDYENPTDTGQNHVYDLVVSASDGTLTDSRTITVTVTAVNEPPVAANSNYETSAHAALSIPAPGLLNNGSDPEGNSRTVVSVGGGVVWDEAVNGDLPSAGPLPVLMLQSGTNEVRGTTGDIPGGDSDLDGFIFEVPANTQLTSLSVTDNRLAGMITQLNWRYFEGSVAKLSIGFIVPFTDIGLLSTQLPLGPGQYALVETGFFKSSTNPAFGLCNYSFKFTVSGNSNVSQPVTLPSGAIVTAQSDGSFSYDPHGSFESVAIGQSTTDSFTYTAGDGHGNIGTGTVTIRIDGANQPPVITSNGGGNSAGISVNENTMAVADVDASDPDAGASLTYSISGGADAAAFAIDPKSGVLAFVTAPDFENPTDSGADNAYDVIVQVSDGGLSVTQGLSVTVTDVFEGCSTLVVNTNDSGPGSLREAINCANRMPNIDRDGDGIADPDTIAFDIPGAGVQTIAVQTQLPTLTEAAIVDGYTQPGAMPNTNAIDDPDPTKRGFNGTLLVELKNGGTSISVSDGLVMVSGGTVRGLIVNSFSHYGIYVGSNCVVAGNLVGVDPSGTLDVGNQGAGIVADGPNNRIGGTLPGSRNVVSGNDRWGIELRGIDLDGTQGNVIAGNFIGTDVTGTKALGNDQAGIFTSQVGSNTIGGTGSGARNIISGNSAGFGIQLESTQQLTISGNYIGVDVSGSQALGNGTGVSVQSSGSNLIGGAVAGAGNVISGNFFHGISITADSNTIQGNFIGTDANGILPVGNALDGVNLSTFFAFANQIGGTAAGAGNRIAFNGGSGVHVLTDTGSGDSESNSILGNSIYANAALGIDLGGNSSAGDGVTPNDAGDADSGPNRLQNFPVIGYATRDAGKLKLRYTVPSDPANSTYPLRIEFFLADAKGQGKTYLGFDVFTQDDFTENNIAGGGKTVTFSTPVPIHVFDKIVGTATDSLPAASGGGSANTSEFSAAATIASPWQNPGHLRWDVSDDTFVASDDVVTIINYINAKGSGLVPDDAANEKDFLDVDGDNYVVAADVIDVINYINAGRPSGGEAPMSDRPPGNELTTENDLLALIALDVATSNQVKRRI